jgi:hypothetical protein
MADRGERSTLAQTYSQRKILPEIAVQIAKVSRRAPTAASGRTRHRRSRFYAWDFLKSPGEGCRLGSVALPIKAFRRRLVPPF